jgi:peptidyl-prolyl cis-trans isomerase B (cyclophilin B)
LPVTPKLCVRPAHLLVAVGLITTLLIAGCGQSTSAGGSPAVTQTPGSVTATSNAAASPGTNSMGERLYTPTYVPNGREIAVIKTSKGTIRVRLYGKDAPINTANFIELAQKGFYDGTRFQRLEPGFVLQGGDPQTKKLSKKQVVKLVADQSRGVFAQGQPMLGTGGPGYAVKGEFDPKNVVHKHVDGALAMARNNDPNSAGSQFYFALASLPELDGKYTVFGGTIKGLDVVHALGIGDVIDSITIENASK